MKYTYAGEASLIELMPLILDTRDSLSLSLSHFLILDGPGPGVDSSGNDLEYPRKQTHFNLNILIFINTYSFK